MNVFLMITKHQRKEKRGTNKDNPNATYNPTDAQATDESPTCVCVCVCVCVFVCAVGGGV